MAQLLVRNVPETVIEALKKRAQENGRSAEAEHRAVLEQTFTPPQDDIWAEMRALADRTRGRRFRPSEDIIRETRDGR